jgi:formylglycine-generating enzyme required for sulfatase activity
MSLVHLVSLVAISGACALASPGSAQTIQFGSGTNAFSLEFVSIGQAGNAADTNPLGAPAGAGAVNYVFQMGKHEISRSAIQRANTLGSLGIEMLAPSGVGTTGADRPAGGISWREAARFVNWLNESYGFAPAYRFTDSSIGTHASLWQPGDAGYDPANPFRNRNARFVIPATDEWYKAAYYNPSTGTYSRYATGSDSEPVQVTGGTAANTAVFGLTQSPKPADVFNCGGLSLYGTMGQGGNVWEWVESAHDLLNDSAMEARGLRGGNWSASARYMASTYSNFATPDYDSVNVGFRVAIVPAPAATLALALAGLRGGRRRA